MDDPPGHVEQNMQAVAHIPRECPNPNATPGHVAHESSRVPFSSTEPVKVSHILAYTSRYV